MPAKIEQRFAHRRFLISADVRFGAESRDIV